MPAHTRILAATLSAAIAGLATAGPATVRVVHASPDAPNVDILVNGAVAIPDLAFTERSGTAELPAGTYQVQVVPAGLSGPIVIDAMLTLDADTDYTVAAVNLLADIEPLVLVDDNTQAADSARIRFVHASPNAPAVDIALAGGAVLFPNVAFTDVADYLAVGGDTYDLEVRLAGTSTVVLDIPDFSVTNRTVYTVYAMGLVGGEPALSAVPTIDAACPSRIRAIHASPDAPLVDVLVDDVVAFPNVPFTAVSPYADLTPGVTINAKVTPAGGAPESAVIDADLTLLPSAEYSVLAINTLANIEPLVLVDDNSLDTENARIRFVHASPNAPAVDIALANGGPVLFPSVTFGENAGYISVPGGTYDLEARIAGTSKVALSVPNVSVDNRSVYTVYAMGFAGGEPALQAVISVDNVCTPEDLDCDRTVGFPDLMLLMAAWGSDAPAEDIDNDGIVGFGDLLRILSIWGPCN